MTTPIPPNLWIKRKAEGLFQKVLQSPKVHIILGARQVGKTSLVRHSLGHEKSTHLNLDLDIDKQRLIAVASLSPTDAVKALGQPEVIVIDEAQRLPDVGRIVKGWVDGGVKAKIILLGSSSLNLLHQSSESLTGRNEKIFLPPLLFREIVEAQSWFSNVFSDDQLQRSFHAQMGEVLLQRLVYGSYPEAITSNDPEAFLLNLVDDYLLKDILQIGLVKTPGVIRDLMLLLAHQAGSEVSVQELATSLRISRVTVDRYLELLEQTFVLFRLPAFSTNPRKEITKSQKIYFWDTGVRNALLKEFSMNALRSDVGILWENWVVAEFAKQNLLFGRKKNLYFWRSRAKSEVDLIVKEGERLDAYEIKWTAQTLRKRAFESEYHVPVQLIDRSSPLISFAKSSSAIDNK